MPTMSEAMRTMFQTNPASLSGAVSRERCGIPVGFLVSGGAQRGDSRAETCYGDAVGSAAGSGEDFGRESVCDARFVSAPGDSTFVWPTGRRNCRVLLSRMAFRRVQRAMRGDSFADEPGQAESGAHFCWTLSMRRA